MKKYLLFVCLLCLPVLLKAQVILNVSIDSMAHDTSLLTSVEKIGDSVNVKTNLNQQLYLSAGRISGNYTLTFSLQTNSTTPFVINPGNKVLIRMVNGDIGEVKNSAVVPSRFGGIGYGHSIKVSYSVSTELFLKLLNNDVSGLSVEYDQGRYEFTLNTNYAAKLKSICSLVK